jgi:nitrogen fixation protein NifU and related proteins
MNDLTELYQEMILEHGRNPRNFNINNQASHQHRGFNPICGDEITLYLDIDANNHITHLSFDGKGCAICMASTSLLTEKLLGCSVTEAKRLFAQFKCLVTEGNVTDDIALGKLTIFSGVRQFPMRIKCATLAWHTMMAALEGKQQLSTTE